MIVYPSIAGRLKDQHQSIELTISSIHPERLHYRILPEKWSIHDNIAHLTRYQSIFDGRVQRILKEVDPAFDVYSAETDEEFELYRSIDTYTLLQQLVYERKLLYKEINKQGTIELGRTGRHPVMGSLSLLKWTEFFLLHEAHHIMTMFKLANSAELAS